MRQRAFHHLPTRARGKRPRCERCEFPYSRALRKARGEVLTERRGGKEFRYASYCVECAYEIRFKRQNNNRGDMIPLRTSFRLTEQPMLVWKD